jgi:hypothetical protein
VVKDLFDDLQEVIARVVEVEHELGAWDTMRALVNEQKRLASWYWVAVDAGTDSVEGY